MRKIILALTAGTILAFASAVSASAQSWRSNGGDMYQGGNPAYAEYRANCIDRLPRWGYRNPCPRRRYQQRGHGGQYGRFGSVQRGHSSGHSVQMYQWHRRTVTTGCLYSQDWVIHNGVKINLGRRPCGQGE